MTAAERSKRWRLANPERWAAVQARYHERHPGRAKAAARRHYERNREQVYERTKAGRLANPERHREYVRVCNRKNVKKRSAYMQAYRQANPEWFRVWNRNLKLRRKGVPGQHRPHQIRLIYESQAGLCYYCSSPLLGVFQVDHMVPVARGGTNWPSNLCCACGGCNQAKRTLTAEEFIAARAAA